MELTLYQIDAFADRPFTGNPAAICPLTEWLPDDVMQAIATENNLSETAYFVTVADHYHIRWFTPAHEVKLCGHATLASAYVLFNLLGHQKQKVEFESLSGMLSVSRDGDWYELNFPTDVPVSCEAPTNILEAFDKQPSKCLRAMDYILVFDDENDVINAKPVSDKLIDHDLRGVAITAPGKNHDFVCRFFAPRHGIKEDPVTGSLYTQLIPYWAERLGKAELRARQVSKRGGDVRCKLLGDRVGIAGQAAEYMVGTIRVPG